MSLQAEELTLHQIGQSIESSLADLGSSNTPDSTAVLSELSQPDAVREMIQRIILDESALTEIASRSYYHANDFLKVVLASGATHAWRLRLHMWHPKESGEPTHEDIHSHRWDFTTALLCGRYTAREYRLGAGDEYYQYKYSPVADGKTFSLLPMGKAHLFNAFEADLPAGTTYRINHEVLHNISQPSDRPVASLLIQQPAVEDHTMVYRTEPANDQAEPLEVEVQRPSPSQLRTEFEQLMEWLP
jgi:hypothetical protein